MARKRYTPEQVIAKLREAEVRMAAGEKTKAVCRSLGIAEQTYYRWRREGLKVPKKQPNVDVYGSMMVSVCG